MKYLLFIILLFPVFVLSQQTLDICDGSKSVKYYVNDANGTDNKWYVNGVLYVTDALTYTFAYPGTYEISVRRDNGLCYAEEFIKVVVTECIGIVYWVPNTFTPDDDEHNQKFGPVMNNGFDYTDFSFTVYNRWGEIIWESRDPNGRWDGYLNGRKCQDGIYTWKIQFSILENDGRISANGNVTIIR